MLVPAMNFFSIDQLPPTPWKNGGGITREIMSWPPGADLASFAWRASVATISASGPFSRFQGVDRVIMLLDGDGVRLRGGTSDWLLDQPGEPFAFSGDEQISSELLGGVSTDFNVMSRRSMATARVEVLKHSCTADARDGGLVMCLSGSWSIGGRALAKGQGCWWTDAEQEKLLEKNDTAPALLVRVSWVRR